MARGKPAESDGYKRIVWVVVPICLTLLGTGVYATIKNYLDNDYIKAQLVELKAGQVGKTELDSIKRDIERIVESVSEGTRSRYTADQATVDRKAVAESIGALRAAMEQVTKDHNDLLREHSRQISELRIFQAQMEIKIGQFGKP